VLNLQLREGFAGGSWEEHLQKFFISGDKCGNYFFIPDTVDRVLLLAHDPPGIEDAEMSVLTFLETETWTTQDILQDEEEGIAVISRTEVIGESILDPVLPAQWREAIAQMPQMQRLGGRPSIFTGELISSPWKDLAYGLFDGLEIQAHFYCGRINVYGREVGASSCAQSVAQHLAGHLGARVTLGSRKRSGVGRRWYRVSHGA
jgi:hypothetical protein